MTAPAMRCGLLPIEELICMLDQDLRYSAHPDGNTDGVLRECRMVNMIYWTHPPPAGTACHA